MLRRVPIRLKLALLVGVPVIGALILATIIARDAQRQAESAAAIGSIEDLAHLSNRMGELIHALQFERHELSWCKAHQARASSTLKERFATTDYARQQLRDFLRGREVSSLPPRLARDLKTVEAKLERLPEERTSALADAQPIDELLGYYKTTNLTLISATAALSQLADDGELLRAISALVIVMQIKERASQEHALLSYVFTANEFPPGSYKDLVTLTTEEADYVNMLHVEATDGVSQQFERISSADELARAAQLRKVALDTQDDDFRVQPEEWSRVQGWKIDRLRGLIVSLNDAVQQAAVMKVEAAARAVRLSYGLGGGVIALSALLAGLIARGVSRSVAGLARAAEQVSQQKNFGIRAPKSSNDEVGNLADAFNEMLATIQERDAELRHHGENLEQLVTQRTVALEKRNLAMRLVLDNVEQGLATIELNGALARERSRAFDDWFGGEDAEGSFAERLARGNPLLRESLSAGWEQVTDGFLPLDVTIEQMPQHIETEGRRYDLRYKAILEREELRGVLLVVSDVTLETERMRRDAEQRELLGVFDRFMRDRVGFIEFFKESEALVEQIGHGQLEPARRLRALHTLKGNCSIFGVDSLATVAHQLESSLAETASPPPPEQLAELTNAWQAFTARVQRLSGTQLEPILEISREELLELETAITGRAPHAKLITLLGRLQFERGIVRLRRIAEQAKSLARRLGKGELEVLIEASPDVRFQAERWAPFWSSFVHVVRNALDHGVEPAATRLAAGKPERPRLKLTAASSPGWLTMEVSDDGRGIDWAAVARKAKDRDLPSLSDNDLVEALFCDGLSTAEQVSEVSGRGVGMSALREAARSLGGTVTVTSTSGVGTTVRFRFPLAETTKGNDASPPSRARPSFA